MKKSDNLTPCRFDGKDIIVDGDLWDWFLDSGLYTPYCYSYNDMSAMFYVSNNPYIATIRSYDSNAITVRAVNSNKIHDLATLNKIFMSWNNEEDVDIYVDCFTHYDNEHNLDFIVYHFNHTDT